MSVQLANNVEALRLFFTEEVYLIDEPQVVIVPPAENRPVIIVKENSSPIYPAAELPIREFNYLGKNKKGILILVHDNENEVSTEEGSALLRNIVKAINLSASDFALVNYARYPDAQFPELSSYFDCKVILSFGVSDHQLGLQSQPLNTLVAVSEAKGIFSSNLKNLCADQQAKKALWASLKLLNV